MSFARNQAQFVLCRFEKGISLPRQRNRCLDQFERMKRKIRLRPGGDLPAPHVKPTIAGLTSFPESVLHRTEGVRKAGLPCVKRMPAYLQLLRVLQAQGQEHVSGTVLANAHQLESVVVRKDLAMTGAGGKPRIGFPIMELITAIERFLGWDSQTKAVLVGVGSLGTALLGYHGFQDFGLRFVGAFDSNPKLVGRWIHGRKVQSLDQFIPFVRRGEIALGVLTVPTSGAQKAADLMVQAGVKGIWNFTGMKLELPHDVVVQNEDLAEGLAVLSHRIRNLTDSPAA